MGWGGSKQGGTKLLSLYLSHVDATWPRYLPSCVHPFRIRSLLRFHPSHLSSVWYIDPSSYPFLIIYYFGFVAYSRLKCMNLSSLILSSSVTTNLHITITFLKKVSLYFVLWTPESKIGVGFVLCTCFSLLSF